MPPLNRTILLLSGATVVTIVALAFALQQPQNPPTARLTRTTPLQNEMPSTQPTSQPDTPIATTFTACDFSKSIKYDPWSTAGLCPDGFACYRKGASYGGIPAVEGSGDQSLPPQIGDNTCRPTCTADSDCANGTSCQHVEVYQGDVGIVNEYMCL